MAASVAQPLETPPAPNLPVLGYEPASEPARSVESRPARALAVLAAVPAAASAFVTFTLGYSPVGFLLEFAQQIASVRIIQDVILVLLALPFLLGVVLLAWHVRLLVRPPATRVEKWLCLSLAMLSAAGTVALGFVVLPELDHDNDLRTIVAIWLALLTVAVAASLLAYFVRTRGGAELPVTHAIGAAYLANAVVCLVAFYDDRQAGWYVTLVACGVMVAGVVLRFAPRLRRPRGRA